FLLSLSTVTGATLTWASAMYIAAARSLVVWAAAKAAAMLALAPWALLAAAIILVADELYTFVTGGETLLGRLIGWFDKIDPEDNALVVLLKAAGALLFDLSDPRKWERLGDAITSALRPVLDWISDSARALG